MWPHHQQAVESLLPTLDDDPDALALILGGSLARGRGRADSDLDGYIVLTDHAMARRIERDDLVDTTKSHHCQYEGGYFDLKCVTRAILEQAVEEASEPFRASLVGVNIAWTRQGEAPLDDLVARIAAYPEAGHAKKVLHLACVLEGTKWFALEAEKREDAYLTLWAAQRAVLFASRLILAHNRVLFPYHKWLTRAVAECPDKPDGIDDAIQAASREPCRANTHVVCDLAMHFQDWGKHPVGWWNPFITEVEWAWRWGPTPIEDR
ncbi:MAG: nucleotidyltransferase domain-containing protein [Planctomycetota bacterium]